MGSQQKQNQNQSVFKPDGDKLAAK